jgi:glycine/sarcosine N-methyltransferase
VTEPEEFYDSLAADYHLLFTDWWAAATWHGAVIADVLVSSGVRPPASILDCTCGIGTQALSLAAIGYQVTGTDISSRSVQRARAEAKSRGLYACFSVADAREVRNAVEGFFDAAVSCDNALPHLLTDADLQRAIQSIRACLRTGAPFVASIRDYDALTVDRPHGVPISLHGVPGARHGAGQSWRWSEDGNYVDITLFTFAETPTSGWQTSVHETRYRALRRDTLTAALRSNGFSSVGWRMSDTTGYYQPMVLAIADDLSMPA